MTDPELDSSDEAREQVARAAAFLHRMTRFWRIPAVLVVLGVAAAAVFLHFRVPMYRSETVILYSEGVRATDDPEQPENGRSVSVRLKEMLMSRASLDSIVRQFDLYPETRQQRGITDAVEEFRKHVEFKAPGGDTFSIAFTGTSPSQAQAVTARLASLVVDQDSDLRKKQATLGRDFLETQKEAVSARLKDAEMALASFMAQHPRFALDATPLANGAAIRATLGASSSAQPAARLGFARPRPMFSSPETAASGARPAPDGAREASAEEARATADLAAARANLADLSARFTAAYPDVRAAQAEVDRATNRVAAARAALAAQETANRYAAPPRATEEPAAPRPVQEPVRGGETTVPIVRPVDSAAAAAAAPPASSRDVVALETEWVKLTRSVTEARQHQDEVEAALFKANSAVNSEAGGRGEQVTLIDPAFSPQSPVPPGRAVILALFVASALLLGAVGAFVAALVDDRVYDVRDVARFAPVLVEIPRAQTRRAHASN